MTPKVTEEMRAALDLDPNGAIEVEDELAQRLYVLIPKESLEKIAREQLLRELQIGFDQADEGDFVTWDPEEIKAEGRRWLEGLPETT